MALLIVIIVPLIACLSSILVRKNIKVINFIAVCASLLELIATTVIVLSVIQNGSYQWSNYFSVEALGAILLSLLSIVGAMAAWYSTGYLKIEMEKKIIGFSRVKQYFALFHLFILAMSFAVVTTNPILMWIAIEATTLSTAFLISFYNKPSAIEAAWKYLSVNTIGLLLAFFGTLLFLYPSLSAGYAGFINWQVLIANAPLLNPILAKIGFVFILIGYGTKVGMVPMHTWLPDAHSKAPAPISSLLSGILLNVAFFAVLRYKIMVDLAIGSSFSGDLLIFFGVLSISVSSLIIFSQKSYKRLLAYSSIEHMGVISLGFGIGGVAAFAALLHMIYHALSKSILFLSAGNIFLKYGSTKIKNIRGMLALLPITGVLFMVGFLAITGVPPFGIFVTEFLILSAGIKFHLIAIIITLLALALVFIGFLGHVSAMEFGEPNPLLTKGEGGMWTIVPVMILVLLLILLSFYMPNTINSLIRSATLNY